MTNRLNLTSVANFLSKQIPELLLPGERGHAAVAMVLREGACSPEVLFIVRAEHDQDPWSGNIGFPGGRLNSAAESPRQAAEREALEELNLDLDQSQYLGRLNDLLGATLPVLVSCFVYQLQESAVLQPNHEVSATFWYPLTKLLESERQQHRIFFYNGEERRHPAVELLDPPHPVLWGITYRLIRNFFEVCNLDFGSPEKTGAASF